MTQLQSTTKNATDIAGIATGNPLVIRQIYTQYFDSIAQYILNNKGTIEDAKDIFQDAMMVIYEKTQQAEFKLQYSLHTFLYTICRNIWLKKLRNKSSKEVSLPDNMELIAEDTFEEEILWRGKEALYREKFKQLGGDCQQVLQSFLKGLSMEKIAKQMGFSSIGYAKKRKYKCKNKLLKLIQSDHRFKQLLS